VDWRFVAAPSVASGHNIAMSTNSRPPSGGAVASVYAVGSVVGALSAFVLELLLPRAAEVSADLEWFRMTH
jgi:hypothetical protein